MRQRGGIFLGQEGIAGKGAGEGLQEDLLRRVVRGGGDAGGRVGDLLELVVLAQHLGAGQAGGVPGGGYLAVPVT